MVEAPASVMVTIPVYVPAARPEVFSAKFSGMQFATVAIDWHARDVPTAAVNQDALLATETLSAREPSPALYASTVCAGANPPVATGIGPTVLFTRRNIGAADRIETEVKRRKAEEKRFF